MPLLSVVVLWLPGQPHEAGSMRLAIGWLHEAGDPPHPILRGGSMTLAIRWLHDGGETAGTWLHEAGDWQIDALDHIGRTAEAEHGNARN